MAIDVTGINIALPPHHGYAVVGELTTTFYQSRPTASGTVNLGSLQEPSLSDYVDKYNTSFTGIRLYTGDANE